MSEKIKPHHVTRKAMLYIRQSSLHQVAHNVESRRLQYAMADRLRRLGWTDVEVMDEDQGRSAGGGVERTGFQRMVAEVCLGKIGAVAAREVSRFARNSRDWQQLVEVCRMVDTLLIDHETVYDPRRGNDRLLLGLKGSLNEYELDLLRQRSVEARRQKARRGELIVVPPVGFVKTDDQRLEKDPDRRVQEAIELVFAKFLELGSVRQTLLWFHDGGAYVYGQTETLPTLRDGMPYKAVRRKPRENWLALIPRHHEGYITWEQFERIQAMISNNAPGEKTGPGASKKGPALLTGLLRCRRCGRKLTVKYTGRCSDVARYACSRGLLDHAEPRCIEFGGSLVDAAVARELLRVIQPGAIEAAVQAGREDSEEHDDFLKALRLEHEAARYAAERAWKQYDASDPSNRLVADELERRWNAALEHVEVLERRIEEEQIRRDRVQPLEPAAFEALASDMESVWNDPETDIRIKKRIARTLIEEIIADVDGEAGQIELAIHWKGGVHSELQVRRRRRGSNSLHTSKEIVEAVRILVRICSDERIAGILSRNGLRTGRGNRWTRERVASLRSKHKIGKISEAQRRAEGWMNLTQAAAYARVSTTTLRKAAERGKIETLHPLSDGPWVFKREDLEGQAAQELFRRAQRHRQKPTEPDPGNRSLFCPTT
jgi:DNA invertase Pin-like site-specific DNA recombinase